MMHTQAGMMSAVRLSVSILDIPSPSTYDEIPRSLLDAPSLILVLYSKALQTI